MQSFRGPLADRYSAAVALVLLALTPYLVLTTAFQPLQQLIAKDLVMSARSLQLTTGMANAAYAVGAVIAVQFASKLPPRRMLLLYATLFVVASVFVAWAPTPGLFIAGHVVQGLTTGLMLIASVPPLVLSWGPDKLPRTAVVMNLGIFGAVALGPVVGGAQAGTEEWRGIMWIVVALGAAALAFAVATYEDQEPQDPEAPIDVVALLLAAAGCGLAFFGVSELMGRSATDAIVLLPLVAGVLLLVVLIAHQWLSENPLIPVRKLAHTVPLTAIVIAMAAGAASVALVQLTQVALQTKGATPNHAGMLFWPEFAMALVAALIFGRLILTRWTAVMAFAGLAVLAGGAVVLTGAARGSDWLVVVGSAMVGIGVGSSVSPALFLAGFSLESQNLPRVFAFVELLRGVAAFLVGPVLLQLAMTATKPLPVGLRTGTWIAGGVALFGLIVAGAIALSGRLRLQEPDVDRWMAGDGTAIGSPPVGGAFRDDDHDDRSDRFTREPAEASRDSRGSRAG
jgi:MFS family permease